MKIVIDKSIPFTEGFTGKGRSSPARTSWAPTP